MQRMFLTLIAAVVLAGGTVVHAQVTPPPTSAKMNQPDVTYARVKEFTAGHKIVLDVDDAPDKSFDLTDKDTKVTVATGLKVGDPVKIVEKTVNGKTMVQISHHSGSAVKHGDKTRTEEKHSH